MVGVYFIYRFIMNGGISRGDFDEAIQDYGRYRAEGTGCVGALLSNVLSLLSPFPGDSP